MTNIEKLYELAGVEKYYLYTVKHLGKIHIAPLEGILENKHLFERNKKSKVKNTYINRVKKVYTPFTAEKQLNLIKWIQINKCKKYLHFVDVVYLYFRELKIKTKEEEKKFMDFEYPQALAGLVCELWEDLTDTQREEIRKILE